VEAWGLWAYAAFLASIRLTLGIAMTPLFSMFGVPMLTRLVLMLVFAWFAAGHAFALPVGPELPTSAAHMLADMSTEVAVGLLMALGVHAAFAVFTVAGGVIDIQMGFSLGAVLDPVSKAHAAVMGRGFSLLAVVLFFLTDAHHLLLAGIFQTFQLIPISGPVTVDGWMPVALGLSSIFSIGFAMAAPVVVALLLTDVVVGVVSRNMPQMNVLFLSIPLKVLLGLVVLSLSMRFMAPVVQQALMLPLTLLNKVQ
jgi:flagellar biosynthesis protein FliR